MLKRTKVVCTIGPASESVTTLEHMMMAGMNVARLNFSHGTEKNFKQLIKNISAARKKTGKTIAILQDLQGPKIRIGKMPDEGIVYKKGQTIKLTIDGKIGTKDAIPVQYKLLPKEVSKGNTIFVNDGKIELKVTKKTTKTITAIVKSGGKLTSNKGINVPGGKISAPPLTAKDKKDLAFGLTQNIDYVALSFVRSANDIKKLRALIEKSGKKRGIIAKIERQEAIDDLEAIIEASDGIMVARGDLGLEIPAAQVPIEQKRIIKLCNRAGKPVIVATQMLDSMEENSVPTRAEVSDIANAVLDKTDAVMLSNETAVGKHPVKATKTLASVAHATEKLLKKKSKKEHIDFVSPEEQKVFNAICLSAVKIAHDIRAKFLVVVTKSGHTAREITKHRPFVPIIAISPHESVHKKLALVWGVGRHIQEAIAMHNIAREVPKILKKHKLVKKGDEIVICNTSKNQDIITTLIIS